MSTLDRLLRKAQDDEDARRELHRELTRRGYGSEGGFVTLVIGETLRVCYERAHDEDAFHAVRALEAARLLAISHMPDVDDSALFDALWDVRFTSRRITPGVSRGKRIQRGIRERAEVFERFGIDMSFVRE